MGDDKSDKCHGLLPDKSIHGSSAYGHQKTGSQGSLTTALLFSNVTLIKTLSKKEDCSDNAGCILGIVLAGLSMGLQIAIGIMLIVIAHYEYSITSRSDDADTQSMEDNGQSQIHEQSQLEIKRKKKRKRTRYQRLNTGILVISFVIVVLNIVLNGLALSITNAKM